MSETDLKPNTAHVVELSTRFETLPVDTEAGPVLWADIRIAYTLAGLDPTVDIRVPVPFEAGETDAQRKAKALHSARLLIDHACRGAGIRADLSVSASVQGAIEGIIPTSLEGVAQELGLISPTTKPKP